MRKWINLEIYSYMDELFKYRLSKKVRYKIGYIVWFFLYVNKIKL